MWWADLDAGPVAACRPLLSEAERARVDRFLMERDRRQRTVAFAMVRTVLARHLRRAPEALSLLQEEHGKPYLADRAVAFNLSHSGSLAVLAVGGSAALGVDVEHMPRNVEFLALSERFFAAPEVAWLPRQPDLRTAFFTVWTRKEAYIKALGTGLRHPLDAFCVLEEKLTDVTGQPLTAWSLTDVSLPLPDYRAALVVEGPLPEICVRPFTWDEP